MAKERRAPRALGMVLGFALATGGPSLGDEAAEAGPPGLTIVDRAITLDRGDWLYWQIDYRLKNESGAELRVAPQEISVRVDGFVSNSRVPGHAAPRRSTLDTSETSGLSAMSVVLPSSDEAHRCRERLIVQAWPAALGPTPPEAVARAGERAVPPQAISELRIGAGQLVHVRLRLEHEHPLYGPHDALLGTRDVELKLGAVRTRDRVVLDRARRPARPVSAWPPTPPGDFLDRRVFLSPPESLHLEAQVPGRSSYRYPDFVGARYGSRMRLSFWYLIAPNSDGRFQARITQYREVPSMSWRTLYDGEVIEPLTVVGRWAHVQRVFRVEPEATTLGLDFRIEGADGLADLWIDDPQIVPVELTTAGP